MQPPQAPGAATRPSRRQEAQRWVGRVGTALVVLIAILWMLEVASGPGAGGRSGGAGGTDLVVQNLAMSTGFMGGEITGTAVNDGDRTYSYAQLVFNLYGADGAQVGSTLANVNNLAPHGRWSFKAVVFEPSAVRCQLSGVTAF